MKIQPKLLKNLITKEEAENLSNHALKRLDTGELKPDPMCINSPAAYNDPEINKIHKNIQSVLEETTGKTLLRTYTYFRCYDKDDVLFPHIDHEACEISVTLQFWSKDNIPWPIYTSKHRPDDIWNALNMREPISWLLNTGDGLLYPGMDVTHFRLPRTGGPLMQAFLHYVDADGRNAWAGTKT